MTAAAAPWLGWCALWGAWVVAARHNHPTGLVNAVASALLVATFAAAVTVNRAWLVPRLWRPGRPGAYAAALLGLITAAALACTVAIHLSYDLLWGPDPARFGFGQNLLMEWVLVGLHVGGFTAVARLWRAAAARAGRPGPDRPQAPPGGTGDGP